MTSTVQGAQKGGPRKEGKNGPLPRHQNSFAFRHNPGSLKTRAILAIPATTGCCGRCARVIEWKRTYRKYKPLTRPRKCVGCGAAAVKLAYHTLCAPCAKAGGGRCTKCGASREEAAAAAAALEELDAQIALLRDTKGRLAGIPERERRTMLRDALRERAQLLDGEEGEEDGGGGGGGGDGGGGGGEEEEEEEEGEGGEGEEDGGDEEGDEAGEGAAGDGDEDGTGGGGGADGRGDEAGDAAGDVAGAAAADAAAVGEPGASRPQT